MPLALVGRFSGAKVTQDRHGLLFRALKNSDGWRLRYQTIYMRWASFYAVASVNCTFH